MQIVCGNCQLTFDAPEGTTGLVCPICRSPLQADAGGGAKPAPKMIDWNGGTLTELIALLSAPAVSARVEVIPVGAEAAIGEVRLSAASRTRSTTARPPTTRSQAAHVTRALPRRPALPDPKTETWARPVPEAGTLDGRLRRAPHATATTSSRARSMAR
jgi:hypothetical protein